MLPRDSALIAHPATLARMTAPRSYGAPLQRVAVLLAGAAAAAIGAYFIFPLWALAIVLLTLGLRDWWTRPVLTLEPAGFHYVVGVRRHYAAWGEVESVRVREERHFLAFGRNIEIDLIDETLIVLSGRQLAADPDDVSVAVEAAWQEAVRSAPQS